MKYILLICRDEKVELDPEARARIPAAAEAWAKEMDGRGVRVEGNALAAISASKAVRVRDGQVLITDGPFAETKEQIGGFDTFRDTRPGAHAWRAKRAGETQDAHH
jgi:hypothetical protein